MGDKKTHKNGINSILCWVYETVKRSNKNIVYEVRLNQMTDSYILACWGFILTSLQPS